MDNLLFRRIARTANGTWDAVESERGLLEKILTRLPVKSIVALKCISKYWYSVICTPLFINMHLSWSKRNQKYLVFLDTENDDGLSHELFLMEANGRLSVFYVIPGFEAIRHPHIISSFNGLICCKNNVSHSKPLFQVDLYICNPSTREVLLLPRGRPSIYEPLFGLAFKNDVHEYKIFKFFSDVGDTEKGSAQCEVYSSKTGTWRGLGRVESCPLINSDRVLAANHVCINGKLYWFTAALDKEVDVPDAILTVDMEEKFRIIDLPSEATAMSFLVELHGHLCFLNWKESRMYIWVYDEDNRIWHLRSSPGFPKGGIWPYHFYSVFASGDKIVFVYREFSCLRYDLVYDVGLATWKDFYTSHSFECETLVLFPFNESLLPCDTRVLEEC